MLGPCVRAAIVIGGDGTLRPWPTGSSSTATATAAPGECPAGQETPLLIVPLGTANLMVRHLGIRWDDRHLDRQVSEAIARRQIVRLDAARACGRLFLLMAGVGFDAHIVHELDRLPAGRSGTRATPCPRRWPSACTRTRR